MVGYKDFAQYMQEKFPGEKVQKISINAGFSCPNRDGTIGRGGCIYCDNTSFTPGYCFNNNDIISQLEEGKKFFSRKYPKMKYLAYFQSFSNTFGRSVENLERIYREALSVEGVVGLIIGTRPDTLPDEVIAMLAELNCEKPVIVEIGAETSHDETLQLINRGHRWSDVENAVGRLHEKGIAVGLHLIEGLPGENEEMMLRTIEKAVSLPIESLKLHHLQILTDTPIERMWRNGEIEITPFNIETYIDLCIKIIKLVPQHIAIERFLASSPQGRVVAPKWGMKNYEFVNLLRSRLADIK
ncbi:MAG: TIGR01212 family radical SAM protein [Muribaculaceae bacterium]|nr:TIGR01212 family radical SAM protein [Muribaculaceae bacterium]